MDEAERQLVEETLANALSKEQEGADVTGLLSDFGVRDLLDDSPEDAVPVVFGLQGSTGTTSRAIHEVMLRSLRQALPTDFPPTAVAISTSSVAGYVGQLATNGQACVDAVVIGGPGDGFVVGAIPDAATSLVVFDQRQLDLQPRTGMDPWLGVVRLSGTCEPLASVPDTADIWMESVSWARIALSYQMLGAARTSLELAKNHALERVQFGRTIGSFQAVKHRLADALVAIEAAQGTVDTAVANGGHLAATVAKSMSGRAIKIAATNCLQVLGGIGFTWEHPLHRYQKRAIALDALLGSGAELPAVIGSMVTASGDVPRLIEI